MNKILMHLNRKRSGNRLLIIPVFILSLNAFGQVRLPKLISDGMVLQRDTEVKIWGWANSSEKINVSFLDSVYRTTANDAGEWDIVLRAMDAGGPYQMQIQAGNTIRVDDILVGDVFVCSGQSNMELPMQRVSWVYPGEIANPAGNHIRQFYVPREYHFNGPRKDLQTGSWKSACPENIRDFSAVAYFFAKALYEKYKVPVGLINSSLGGSPAEAWMSEEALKAFPVHYQEALRFKDTLLIKRIKQEDQTRIRSWYELMGMKDMGYQDPQGVWYDPDINTTDWETMEIPGYWSEAGATKVNGVVWFRKKVIIPPEMAGEKAMLILGRIVDADSVFLNGEFVGTTSYQYPPRRYHVPGGLLQNGENTIVIRVISNAGRGGFARDKLYGIVSGDDTLDLTGEWQYRFGAEMEPLRGRTFIRNKPAGLYNAMIAPLQNYTIKGVIWYQGESNAYRSAEYTTLFPALINDWRNKWHCGAFPFLYVQLPNFMEPREQPSESNWALMREAQLKTLSVRKTGMAVAIDIGEWNDIHPLNKKEVGRRIALAARKVAYGEENIIYSGPLLQDMDIEESRIILTFTNTGSGLIAKGGGCLKQFAVAGADKHFVWAKAKIINNKVIVWCPEVSNPVAVRYAWADNPEGANLYNKEGLPASPFRTDDWAGQ